MGRFRRLTGLAFGALYAAAVQAGPCDARYTFDADLNDHSGNGHNGQMIGKDGEPASPTFVAGRSGQALRLDGSVAMRTPLDLNPDLCPQMTVVAWLRIEPNPSQMIFGNNGGNHLMTSGSSIALRTAGRDLRSTGSPVRPGGGWLFVAGVWDYATSTHRLHWGSRMAEAGFEGRQPKAGDSATWVGALNDKLHFNAKDIVVDEMHFIGQALTPEQIDAIRSGGGDSAASIAAGSPAATAPATGMAAGAVASCSTHADCGEDSYCAVDGTCHPNSHLPMQDTAASGSGVTLDDLRRTTAERTSGTVGQVDVQSPTDILPDGNADGDTSGGRSLSDMQAEMAERNADRVGDLDFDSPTDILEEARQQAGDTSYGSGSGGPAATSQEGDSERGTASGMGSMSVGDYLAQIPISRIPQGDTNDCRSFAQRIGDLATNFRDTFLDYARNAACSVLLGPVANLAVAAGVDDPTLYQTSEFQREAFTEAYRNCMSATPEIVNLPDAMIAFWNNQVANNNWSTLGPRRLDFGAPHSGNIISPGDRTFISSMPWDSARTPHLALEEFSGRARIRVTMCAIDPFTQRYAMMRRFMINDTREQRQDERETFIYTVQTGFSFISVYLDGRSTPDRHFRYTLSVAE